MNIEKLQMCRLCLVEDVRMFNVTNKDLQTLYEKLTDIPFVTEDSRPMLACVFCYTKLKQCCQLQRKCLEAEKIFTEMLNKDHEKKPQVNKDLLNNIKEELPDDCEEHNDINEIKEEHQTESIPYLLIPRRDVMPTNHPESASEDTHLMEFKTEKEHCNKDREYMPTNHSESDSEDDTPVMEFKIEEPDVSENKLRAEETKRANDALSPELNVRITRLEDTTTAQHKKTARNTLSPTPTVYSTSKKLPRNTKSISNNKRKQKYVCDVCQHSSISKSKLIVHIRIHTGEKPHKCDLCQKSFSTEPSLIRHNRVHTGEKPYKCDTCQRSFSEAYSLTKHFRVHTGERPYKCEICQKRFKLLENLKKHNRVHTDEKPYQCEICQSSFKDVYNFKTHVRLHSDGQLFKCEICQRKFSYKGSLKKHLRSHSGPH